MKKCFKCNEEKDLSEFYKHKQMADGHLNKCVQCAKQDVARHRSENLSEIREYDRRRALLPHRREKNLAVGMAWRLAHPERRAAQVALGNAVNRGDVTPWPVCAMPECDGKPEAHHPDYSRPLDVVWLCSPHHKQAHAETKRNLSNACN